MSLNAQHLIIFNYFCGKLVKNKWLGCLNVFDIFKWVSFIKTWKMN